MYLPCLFAFYRRRRHYAKLDLQELLGDKGIKTECLMPKPPDNNNILLNSDPDNPAPFPSFLPLEIFDNVEYDCRTPEEWVCLGEEEGVRKPVPGLALIPAKNSPSTGMLMYFTVNNIRFYFKSSFVCPNIHFPVWNHPTLQTNLLLPF